MSLEPEEQEHNNCFFCGKENQTLSCKCWKDLFAVEQSSEEVEILFNRLKEEVMLEKLLEMPYPKKCIICNEVVLEPIELECKHSTCSECFEGYLEDFINCP